MTQTKGSTMNIAIDGIRDLLEKAMSDLGTSSFAYHRLTEALALFPEKGSTGWRSIDSAPRPELADEEVNRYILAVVPEDDDPEAIDVDQTHIRVVWWEPHWDNGPAWVDDAGLVVKPTHWMPLPLAPVISNDRGDP